MKNFIYFLGGHKDGQTYNGDLPKIGEPISFLMDIDLRPIHESQSSPQSFTDQILDEAWYSLQEHTVGDQSKLFMVYCKLDDNSLNEKLKHYFD